MVALYDKLRPQKIEDIVGFDGPIKRLLKLRDTLGWDGQVFWISGVSGTGKTTLARCIASTISPELDVDEVDAADVSMDMLRDWERRCHYSPMAGFKAHSFIINESHTLNTKIVSRLQTLLEMPQVQKRGTFLFTTTERGQQLLLDTKFDAFPFLSRAIKVKLELTEDTCKALAEYLCEIGNSFGMEHPLSAYEELLVECRCNMRDALQRIAIDQVCPVAA